MKKVITLLFILHFWGLSLYAQKELWGVSRQTNGDLQGNIVKFDMNGENAVTVHHFNFPTGKLPSGKLFLASNGKLYGTATYGGIGSSNAGFEQDGYGVLYEYNLIFDTYRVVHFFNSISPTDVNINPLSVLIEPIQGKLYGGTIYGGFYVFDIATETESYLNHNYSFVAMGGIVYSPTNASMGNSIGVQNIPILQPGQEVTLNFPWIVPNPADYGNVDQWHFCLLARIVSSNDPMTFTETWDINSNTRNNNNIAWKNVTVVSPPNPIVNPTPIPTENEIMTGTVAVGNPFNEHHTFFLELVKEDLETGKPIYDEAEVSIKMDQILYDAWTRGGKEAQLLDETANERKKIIKGNNVIIDNLAFNPNEFGTLNITFNFLTKELTDKTRFIYHVIQKDALTGEIIGGETYIIKKQVRNPFIADAGGDKIVDKNELITIIAQQINEAATYNWYDTNGNLVFTGKDLTISTDVAKKYKLEVIATVDGFKDYAEVSVNFKPSTLEIITPNPSSNSVNISYKLNDVNSAYLMVLGTYGTNGTTSNYILDVNSENTNIDISNYQNGFYTVALVCNGKIIDAKTLIKN